MSHPPPTRSPRCPSKQPAVTPADPAVADSAAPDTAVPAQPAAYEPNRCEEREDWYEEPVELPRRPRRRLLSPIPLALLGVLLAACGFIGGVLVEKGQTSSSTPGAGAASSLASRFAALRAGAAGASGAAGSAAAGGAFGAGGGGATSGSVAYISGNTLYVTTAEGNTVKVTTSAGTTVTKTVKSEVKGIHPGETVTVTGASEAKRRDQRRIDPRGGGGGGLGALFGSGSARWRQLVGRPRAAVNRPCSATAAASILAERVCVANTIINKGASCLNINANSAAPGWRGNPPRRPFWSCCSPAVGLAACGGSSSSSTGTTATAASASRPQADPAAAASAHRHGRHRPARGALQSAARMPAEKRHHAAQTNARASARRAVRRLPRCGGRSAAARRRDTRTVRSRREEVRRRGLRRRGTPDPKPRRHSALTKFAACMRENGVNVPAPNTSGSGPDLQHQRDQHDRQRQFQQAESKCRTLLQGTFRRGAPGGGPPAGTPPSGGRPGTRRSGGIAGARAHRPSGAPHVRQVACSGLGAARALSGRGSPRSSAWWQRRRRKRGDAGDQQVPLRSRSVRRATADAAHRRRGGGRLTRTGRVRGRGARPTRACPLAAGLVAVGEKSTSM